MPDFYGRLVSLMNTQAQTNLLNQQAQDYEVLGQQRRLQVAQFQQNQLDDQLRRQITFDTMNGQQGTQVRGNQTIEGDPGISNLTQQLANDQSRVNSLRQLATNLVNGRASLAAIDENRKNLDAAEQRAVASERELRLEKGKMAQTTGSIAAGAVDDLTFRNAYQQLAQINPSLVANVDRDDNGIPYFGSKSQAAMKSIAAAGMSAYQTGELQVRAQDEIRKAATEARLVQDEKRRQDKTDADVAWRRSNTPGTSEFDERERAKSDAADKAAARKLANTATQPATPEMKKKALASILAEDKFQDKKFDSSVDAFAGDVADRANKIRADAAKSGNGDIGLDEARDRAIQELLPNVVPITKGGVNLPVLGKTFGTDVYSYRRNAPAPAKPSAAPTTTQAPATADEYLKSIGVR